GGGAPARVRAAATEVAAPETPGPFPSGSRRRAVLVAHSATCDVYVFGADRKLRVYNPKVAGPLSEVKHLQPLIDDFLH
ncbi:MAG: hypothetical protein SGPRY_004077, partial [Prymnesium sp.]